MNPYQSPHDERPIMAELVHEDELSEKIDWFCLLTAWFSLLAWTLILTIFALAFLRII